MSIVDRIIKKSAQNGYTIASLEKDLHMGNGTISHWNKGRLYADNLFKVANKLHTSMDYLYSGEELQDKNALSSNEQEWIALYRELVLCDPELIKECRNCIMAIIKSYQIGKESESKNRKL